jgi:hypothetical protein
MLVLLVIGTYALVFKVPPVRAEGTTITINADGSITPSTAPISTVDNIIYTFTGNINYPTYNGIVVERSNIIINGNGYAVQRNNDGTESDYLNGVLPTCGHELIMALYRKRKVASRFEFSHGLFRSALAIMLP